MTPEYVELMRMLWFDYRRSMRVKHFSKLERRIRRIKCRKMIDTIRYIRELQRAELTHSQ